MVEKQNRSPKQDSEAAKQNLEAEIQREQLSDERRRLASQNVKEEVGAKSFPLEDLEDAITKAIEPEEYEDLTLPNRENYEKDFKRSHGRKLAEFLANDIVAGMILIIAAIAALLFANSPWRHTYQALSELHLGIPGIDLNLSVTHWAQDGLLTIFFFAVGLELKHEFVAGSLRSVKVAALPIIAAVFGMIMPALVFVLGTAASGDGAWHGWAIPTATDIAFAVAILQIFGRGLPPAARTFLLTLAVADDLGGILVIAIFYASGFDLLDFLIALAVAAIFGLLVQKRIGRWWILIPLAVVCWYFMHASGVHATIAGVLLGMTIPAKQNPGEKQAETDRFLEYVNPISAGIAVPVFAFFAAGVDVMDGAGPAALISHPVTLSVLFAMPIGKFLGIFGSVLIFTKFTSLRLGEGVTIRDIFPISFTAGIGFTVALLISHLAFGHSEELTQAGSLGVLLGTLCSALLAAFTLNMRVRQIKRAGQAQKNIQEEHQHPIAEV